MAPEELNNIELLLQYHFENPQWLEQALTHRSARQQESGLNSEHNDRLEFFGDRVIGLVVSEHLLKSFPDWDAGKLSKAYARLVSGASMHIAAEAMSFGRYLRLGRGEEMTGGREKQSLLEDAYEAVVAAIYLDGGLAPASNFVHRTLLIPLMAQSEALLYHSDHKSALQEWIQRNHKGRVEYRLWRESGPDHQKLFEVEAWLEGKRLASSSGRNKKEAEQAAARQALELLLTEGVQK
jgi:ribonuclease-3